MLTSPLKVDGLARLQLTAQVGGAQGLGYDVKIASILLDICNLHPAMLLHCASPGCWAKPELFWSTLDSWQSSSTHLHPA